MEKKNLKEPQPTGLGRRELNFVEKNKVLDLVKGKVKNHTKDSSDGHKVKYREL